MSYLINSTRLAEVKIQGVDVTDRIVEISLSDSSGVKNGLIATDGEVKLAYRPGSPDREDYQRNTFARGSVVTIDIVFPSGNRRRHPRGYLFVIDSNFDPQDESIRINVGCGMAFAALDGDVTDILPLPELFIPKTREDYQSISAALATEGRIAWYDGYGTLRSSKLFEGDTGNYSPPGKWVSVFGVTAQAISPLDSTRSIVSDEGTSGGGGGQDGGGGGGGVDGSPYQGTDPDNILVDWEEPSGPIDPDTGLPDPPEDDPDDPGAGNPFDVTLSEAFYYTQYPVIHYERVPPEPEDPEDPNPLEDGGDPQPDSGLDEARPSDCVDELTESDNPAGAEGSDSGGDDNGDTDCMENWETVRTPLYVGVKSTEYAEAYYDGPGKSKDRSLSKRSGPALEINSQYFGDVYQVCRQSWATRCNPNGYCPTAIGQATVTLEETTYKVTFNPDGSVATETAERFVPFLAAARPDDWRSGVVDGKIKGFRRLEPFINIMYRSQVVIVEHLYPKNGSRRVTTTYDSITSRGTGLPSSINRADAYNGIKTVRRESSYTLGLNPEQPAALAQPEPPTETKESEIVFPKHESSGTAVKGTFVFQESIPFPIYVLKLGNLTIKGVVNNYEDYLRRCLKGMSLGLRLGESLREEIISDWAPNVPFRYADPRYNTVISMRGDAHTWSMTPEQCVFTVDGLNIGFSNGRLNIPDNIVGATTAVL